MNKDKKKIASGIMLAVALVALISIVAIAYAQGNDGGHKSHHTGDSDMMDMMGGKGMDEMHKQMTKNLDPETKNQIDKMHEICKKSFEETGMMEEGMVQQ